MKLISANEAVLRILKDIERIRTVADMAKAASLSP